MIGHYRDLKNKVFLVTGASSGIGQAIAIALAQQGATLIITGRDHERLQSTCQQAGTGTTSIVADLTKEAERNNLVDALPTLDGICHAAGIIDPFPIRYLDEQRFDKLFNINAKAPILLTARLLGKKKLNSHSAILFVSSVSSNRAMKGGSMYSASKSAIEAFCRTITLEHASDHIRANYLKPGLVKTALFEQAEKMAAAGSSSSRTNEYISTYPLGIGNVSDIAAAALFLLSESSRWVSGAGLTLDGSFSNQI